VEGGCEAVIAEDVAWEIGEDGGFEGAVAVGEVDGEAEVFEELGEAGGRCVGAFEVVDERGEESDLGESEEGVDEVVAVGVEADGVAVVDGGGEVFEGLVAVEGFDDVSSGVDLEDVAVELVDEEAAEGEGGVVGEVSDGLGVASVGDEAVEGE
jgi:hypothetical protein